MLLALARKYLVRNHNGMNYEDKNGQLVAKGGSLAERAIRLQTSANSVSKFIRSCLLAFVRSTCRSRDEQFRNFIPENIRPARKISANAQSIAAGWHGDAVSFHVRIICVSIIGVLSEANPTRTRGKNSYRRGIFMIFQYDDRFADP